MDLSFNLSLLPYLFSEILSGFKIGLTALDVRPDGLASRLPEMAHLGKVFSKRDLNRGLRMMFWSIGVCEWGYKWGLKSTFFDSSSILSDCYFFLKPGQSLGLCL